MSVTASIQVQFGSASGTGHLSAAVDTVEGGLNNGKTSFLPGETVHFLVWQSTNVTHETPVVSAGSVNRYTGSIPDVSTEKEQDIQFADSDSATLSVPASSITSTTWMGRSLGTLTLQGDGQTVKTSSSGVAIARVKYRTTTPTVYRLTSPTSVSGLTDFSILVLITGSEVT